MSTDQITLSDFMNHAATAAVMCPIAISSAYGLGVSVAVGIPMILFVWPL